MTTRQHIKTIGSALATLALGLISANANPANTKKELLELTGGKRVKVVWNQGGGDSQTIRLFDSKSGDIRELGPAGSAPLFTHDGSRIIISIGKAKERVVMSYDTETGKGTELVPAGAGNNVLAVWTDPKTKRTWVYVNGTGDENEPWNEAKGGAINRFPTDKPAERELFWDRTTSHIYLMFSEDGTRACFEPSWANIGQLKLAFTADGRVDQDKSEYKTFGGGCFPSMAPDNSYRLFRLDGDHHSITMHDADGGNARKIAVSDIPGVKDAGKNVWLTRWATHPRYMTQVAPAGDNARIWMGRFNEDFTGIEKWVAVSEDGGPQCWQSQAWVEPDK